MRSVLFFGIFDPEYSRNRILMKGFRENGWSVDMCRVDPRQVKGIGKYVSLWRAGREAKRYGAHDLVIVAFPGQTVAWMARIIFGRTVVLDAFTSLFDSNVHDRRLYAAMSARGIRDFLFDWVGFRCATRSLADTNADADYMSERFGVDKKRFIRVFVGTTIDRDSSIAARSSRDLFIVHFHGSYLPLQGTETIVRAATLLEQEGDIRMRMIGDGLEYERTRALAGTIGARNIEFLPRMPFSELSDRIREASIVLGIFGTTPKAQRVIPNKVFEAIGAGKAVVTADTRAARELLEDDATAVLVRPGDPKSLADAVIRLKNDPALVDTIERNAAKLASELSPKSIVSRLIRDISIS